MVTADPEGTEFCVLDWHDPIRDTRPILSVVVDCADPRAMACFWGTAINWTLERVTNYHAPPRASPISAVPPHTRREDVRNRLHLAIRLYPCDGLAAETARLRTLRPVGPAGSGLPLAWPSRSTVELDAMVDVVVGLSRDEPVGSPRVGGPAR
jgi:hypothetical protein